MNRRNLLLVVVLAFGLTTAAPAPAGAAQLDTIVNTFQLGAQQTLDRARLLGLTAYKALVALEIVMTLYAAVFLFMNGKMEMQGFLATVVQKAIVVSLGLIMLEFYPVFVPKIISTFTDAGSQLVGLHGITPSVFVGQGLYLAGMLFYTSNNAGFLFAGPVAVLAWASGILIFVCFTLVAWRLTMVLCEGALLLGGGVFFLGFWGSRITAPLAENYLVVLTRLGIHTYFLYMVVSVANILVPTWAITLAMPVNSLDGLLPMLTTVAQVLITTLIATKLPAKLAHELTAPSSFLHLRSSIVAGV